MHIKTATGWRRLDVYTVNDNDLHGVFVDTHLVDVRSDLDRRTDRFCHDLHEFHPVNNAGKFRGDHYIEPLFGAFGEKL